MSQKAGERVDGPLVSVIVPTRNSERTLGACLLSVSRQTHHEIELVVVDNSSHDRTVAIAREFADEVLEAAPERSAQRNAGARRAKGAYLLFVDSDMILETGVVSECLVLFQRSPTPGIVISEVSVGEGFWARCRAFERNCYAGDDLVEAPRFLPRTVFEAVGGFDEDLTGPEDWDLAIRIRGDSSFPRTSARIIHDEGRATLSKLLAKKLYYARSYPLYLRKHRGIALKQANIVARPAFFRNWRRLRDHPTLAVGLLVLKALELTAAVAGLVMSVRARRRYSLSP